MNLLWILAITIFVFLEKVLAVDNWSARIGWFAGIGLIVSGGGVLVIGLTFFYKGENSPSLSIKEGEQ